VIGQSEYRRFEELVYRLFAAYLPADMVSPEGGPGRPDLLVRLDDNQIPVEVKLYGSTTVNFSRLDQAIATVNMHRERSSARIAVLVVSIQLTPQERHLIRERHQVVTVLDLVDIFFWSAIDLGLYDDITSFFTSYSGNDEAFQAILRSAVRNAQSRKSVGKRTRALFEYRLVSGTGAAHTPGYRAGESHRRGPLPSSARTSTWSRRRSEV
jgi:hypothetical protein